MRNHWRIPWTKHYPDMPELVEVKLTSEFIHKHGYRQFVRLEKSPVSKVKTDLSGMTFETFSLESFSRGKELVMDFIDHTSSERKRMKITLGMSGTFLFFDPLEKENEKYLRHSHLRMYTSEGKILALHDVRRFAKWSWGEFDLSGRGPCPLTDHQAFREHVEKGFRLHKDFSSNLSEIMMSQKWFNGIGNYLRAEILYRLDVNPFRPATDLTTLQLEKLLDLCRDCTATVYSMGGGQLKDWKNPEGENPVTFRDWVKCYGKKASMVDGTRRKFWYHEKWNSPIPEWGPAVNPVSQLIEHTVREHSRNG